MLDCLLCFDPETFLLSSLPKPHLGWHVPYVFYYVMHQTNKWYSRIWAILHQTHTHTFSPIQLLRTSVLLSCSSFFPIVNDSLLVCLCLVKFSLTSKHFISFSRAIQYFCLIFFDIVTTHTRLWSTKSNSYWNVPGLKSIPIFSTCY